jgi:hypothetical protein
VHEVVLRLYQHDVGDVVERPGDLDARVAAAEDHDDGPGRGTLGHRGTPVEGRVQACSKIVCITEHLYCNSSARQLV